MPRVPWSRALIAGSRSEHSTAAAVSAEAPDAADRRTRLFVATKPEVLADQHWPTLAAQMDRIAATGADVAALVDQVLTNRALPAEHPARSLDYRLANAAPRTAGPRPHLEPGEITVSRPNPPAAAVTEHRRGPSR